jgi:hypothetical protein
MGLEALIFLGETEMPWLAQKSETKQVKEAFKYFEAQIEDVTFNGGLIVDNSELPEFIKRECKMNCVKS